MSDVSFYFSNVLKTADDVTATNLNGSSSVEFLSDDRLSFAVKTTTTGTEVSVDQSSGAEAFDSVIVLGHNMVGGSVTMSGSTSTDFGPGGPGTSLLEGAAITNPTTQVFELASGTRNDPYLYIRLEVPTGSVVDLGELIVGEKFTAEQPKVGLDVLTTHVPRTTVIPLPNGEFQTQKHAEIVRQKLFTFPGLTLSGSEQFLDALNAEGGTDLFVVSDDRGDVYPGYIETNRQESDFVNIVEISFTFTEVKLK